MSDWLKTVIGAFVIGIPAMIFFSHLDDKRRKRDEEKRKEQVIINRAMDYYDRHHDSEGNEI